MGRGRARWGHEAPCSHTVFAQPSPHLGRHVVGRAAHGVRLAAPQLLGETEVGHLQVPRLRDEQVLQIYMEGTQIGTLVAFHHANRRATLLPPTAPHIIPHPPHLRLEVPEHEGSLLEVLEGEDDAPGEEPRAGLAQGVGARLEEGEELPAHDVLHEHVDVVLVAERGHQVHREGRRALEHHLLLTLHVAGGYGGAGVVRAMTQWQGYRGAGVVWEMTQWQTRGGSGCEEAARRQ